MSDSERKGHVRKTGECLLSLFSDSRHQPASMFLMGERRQDGNLLGTKRMPAAGKQAQPKSAHPEEWQRDDNPEPITCRLRRPA